MPSVVHLFLLERLPADLKFTGRRPFFLLVTPREFP